MDYRIYAIHGTFAADSSQRGNKWWQKESPFSEAVLSYLDTQNYRVNWEPYRWSGDNKTSKRTEAVKEFSEVLSKVDHNNLKAAVIAHSHGGNVIYGAMDIAKNKYKVPELPVITIGTPFIFEANVNNLIFDGLPKIKWASLFTLFIFTVSLFFLESEGLLNTILITGFLISVCIFFSSIYINVCINIASGLWKNIGFLNSIFNFSKRINKHIYSKNLKYPKIYSMLDEAINALKAIPSQKEPLATTEMAHIPAAITIGIFFFIIELLFFQELSTLLTGDIVSDFGSHIPFLNESLTNGINKFAILFILLIFSFIVGLIISRMFLAKLMAGFVNRLFSSTIKERAFGRDTGMSRALPKVASANLPLLGDRYSDNQLWKPLPKSIDDELEDITIKSAVGMFKSVRDTLGMGMTTGSYTFSETLSTNYKGDELIHSVYFSHPDMPGFIAWILCEFYGFPKGTKYTQLPIKKYESWWDDIRPDPWPPVA